MTVKEAAAYLTARDYPCSVGTVRALANAGRLPCYRPGLTGRGRMSFRADQLDDFLAQAAWNRPGTAAPPPAPRAARAPRPPRAAATPAADWRQRLKDVTGK